MSKEFNEIRDSDVDRILREKFTTYCRNGYISLKGFCITESYQSFVNVIENFKVRDDDIWVCSFPRTGTTWTQEMVWCIANDLDYDGAKVPISERFPFFELSSIAQSDKENEVWTDVDIPNWLIDSLAYIEKQPSPRFIKSHLPFELLPREIREGTKKPKIVYVTRNPKDACISHFHHSKAVEGFRGDFQDFCTLYLAGKICYAPLWNHVLQYWNRRNNNVLFLKYEDMKNDLASVIRKTADFLGKSSNGGWASNQEMVDTNVKKLMEHLSFQSMKSNPAIHTEDFYRKLKNHGIIETVGMFMRKGETEQWKTEMTQEICDKFDKVTREAFENSDLIL